MIYTANSQVHMMTPLAVGIQIEGPCALRALVLIHLVMVLGPVEELIVL